MVDNNQIITAETEEEFVHKLEQVWADVSHRAARRAAETVIRTERREKSVKRLNQVLLAVATILVFLFPLECALVMQLQASANAYACSIGL